MRHLAGYRETASPSQSLASTGTFHSHPCAPDPPGRQGAAPAQPLPWRRPVRPSVPIPVLSCGPCRRARLPRGWAPSPPRRRRVPGGSADLMNFYATSYALAHGRGSRRPTPKAGGGLVPGAEPPLPTVTQAGRVSVPASATTPAPATCPTTTRPSPACSARGTQQRATARTPPRPPPPSTSSPSGSPTAGAPCPGTSTSRGAGYLQESSLTCLRTGAVSPQQTRHLQGPPKASREHGTESHRTGPAQPDVLQKMTIGTTEQSGFTRPTPRSDSVLLPALPGQPLGVSITTTDYLPSVRSHGGETLPALPAGSERGSGFSREVPGCLGTAVSRTPSHCPSPRALPVLTRCPHPGLAHGGPPRPARLPRAAGTPRDPGQPAGTAGCWQEGGCRHDPGPVGLCTQTTSIPQEPSGFTTNHGQRVTPRPPLSPAAPARCWRGPTWMARPTGGDPAPVPQRLWHQQPPHRTGGHHQPLPGVAPPERPEVVLPHPGGPRLGSSPGFFGDPPSPWEHAEK
ncbi:stabilizer of axonemal microtubules 4 isoform 1-T1 [Spheniscus humboldti]